MRDIQKVWLVLKLDGKQRSSRFWQVGPWKLVGLPGSSLHCLLHPEESA